MNAITQVAETKIGPTEVLDAIHREWLLTSETSSHHQEILRGEIRVGLESDETGKVVYAQLRRGGADQDTYTFERSYSGELVPAHRMSHAGAHLLNLVSIVELSLR